MQKERRPADFGAGAVPNHLTYARHNAVNDYAKKNGIPFLDLDLKRKRIGFSWKTDSRDAGNHLNCYGAKKVSLYVGQ